MAILGVLEHSSGPVSTEKLHLGQCGIYELDSLIRDSKTGYLEQLSRKMPKISQMETKKSLKKSELVPAQKQKLGWEKQTTTKKQKET